MALNDGATINLSVSRRYEVAAERVFDAWLDAQSAGRWLFATPTGQMVHVEIDGRAGGNYLIVDRRDGEDVEHFGQYLEIDRPHRLVFSFSADKHDRDGDRVSVKIKPIQTGCELTLTHEMAAKWAGWEEQTTQGWNDILEGLARTLRTA